MVACQRCGSVHPKIAYWRYGRPSVKMLTARYAAPHSLALLTSFCRVKMIKRKKVDCYDAQNTSLAASYAAVLGGFADCILWNKGWK
eukprot:1145546-Pelagomonas_calceolata.AAC.1